MKNIIVASTRKSAGKTGMILGLSRVLDKRAGYVKPLGDRLLYRKKRLWDYDSAVVTSELNTGANAEDLTIGFEQSKLRFMYTREQLDKRLAELVEVNREERELLFVECGRDFSHGISVGLDALSVARAVGGRLVIVAGGPADTIVDDLTCLKPSLMASGVEIAGVIANKIKDPVDFEVTHLNELRKIGLPVLGVVPYQPQLGLASVHFLSDCLFARVIAGERNLDRYAGRLLVGAMSTDAVLRSPAFRRDDKLVITSGDRSDMILAAVTTGAAAIVLTNNILPPPNIVSRADEAGVPLLLVPGDTFQVAKTIDDMEMLVTPEDTVKKDLLAELVLQNVDFGLILG